jgi:hypothetical protein
MIRHRWLLIVAIAAALVGMHHLVAERRGHAGPFAHAPLTLAAGVGSLLMSPTPPERPPAVASDQGRRGICGQGSALVRRGHSPPVQFDVPSSTF